ncbi:LuxR C-terminal-related transcriptional regulator [Streptomyces olivaceiscleroticus]|uniref:LuxR C-terminal-related transcriptional regulator n=1 Tax=Streptomyces olivaceiscleroticus TaxID=68245 RepID=UPI003D157CD1
MRARTALPELLNQGLGIGEIARRLGVSKQTISERKASVMRKLGVVNDAALFVAIAERGLLP